MDVSLRVNRVSDHYVQRPVTYDGEEALAQVMELQVELHDETSRHGSMTLHFFSKDHKDQARDLFQPGSLVTVTFARGADAEVSSLDTDVSNAEASMPDQQSA
jgi:hypothetical protein